MRLGEAQIQDSKRVGVGLTAIYGIGRSLAIRVCQTCGINPVGRVGDLDDVEIGKLKIEISKCLTEGDLRRYVLTNIRRLISINCYRGTRHRKNLPVRGQRTRTNARTRRRVTSLSVKPKMLNEKRQK